MSSVLVAMSGGVDSSVAAAMLMDAGHDVVGVTLKLWGGESDSGCCSLSDVEDARRVAAQLGIAHYVFNFTEEFDANVVDPYVDAYAKGRTPNPCVECNRHLKFGALLQRADQLGVDFVATGHHARITDNADGTYALRRGADAAKDQSYVLYMLNQEALRRTLFPVGEITKEHVRAEADRLGLRTATKRESMDVCFIKKGGREAFLGERIGRRPGSVVDGSGQVLGTHDGVAAFTVGQRRRVGVALGERTYVVDVDAATNTVTVGARKDLLCERIDVEDWCWTTGEPESGQVFDVQTRAHGAVFAAVFDDGALVPVAPVPRVAPGQVVACYAGDELVGGALAV
ncbi:MAG: tRNA 2-thiouridine(34) synthase MnmA [Acidimicrobiia bacterium]